MFKTIFSIFIKQQADLLIGAIVTSAARNKLMDFPNPIFEDQLVLLIPKPILETRYNFLNSILQPFQLNVCTKLFTHCYELYVDILLCIEIDQIWIYLTITICIGIATLYTLGRISSRMHNLNQLNNDNVDDERSRLEKSIIFVCGLILMQGFTSFKLPCSYYLRLII